MSSAKTDQEALRIVCLFVFPSIAMVTDLSCHHTVHHVPSSGARDTSPKCTLPLYTSFHAPADLGLSSITGLSFVSLALDLRSALFLSSASRSFHQRPVHSSSYLHMPDHSYFYSLHRLNRFPSSTNHPPAAQELSPDRCRYGPVSEWRSVRR